MLFLLFTLGTTGIIAVILLYHKPMQTITMSHNVLIFSKQELETTINEAVRNALHEYHSQYTEPKHNEDAFGDLNWLYTVYPDSISKATIKHKSAMGKIPGKFKIGRRVLYDKAVVLSWMHSLASTEKIIHLSEKNLYLNKDH